MVAKAWDEVDAVFERRTRGRAVFSGAGPRSACCWPRCSRSARPRDARARHRHPTAPSRRSCAISERPTTASRSSRRACDREWRDRVRGRGRVELDAMAAIPAEWRIVCLTGRLARSWPASRDRAPARSTGRWCWRTTWSRLGPTPRTGTTRLAGEALAAADHGWLERLITRRVRSPRPPSCSRAAATASEPSSF